MRRYPLLLALCVSVSSGCFEYGASPVVVAVDVAADVADLDVQAAADVDGAAAEVSAPDSVGPDDIDAPPELPPDNGEELADEGLPDGDVEPRLDDMARPGGDLPIGCVPDPAGEACDSVDNDCNGLIDDVPGWGAACDNGLLGGCFAVGEMACKGGLLTCVVSTPGSPKTEVCDGLDNDCNGLVDDAPGVFQQCFTGVGACTVKGQLACADGGGLFCDAPDGSGNAVTEYCNGQDSDCNGVIDDVPGAGAPCTNGLSGVCFAAGVMECAGGGLVCSAPTANVGSVELCNGLDDDCNGKVDDVIGAGESCDNGEQGVCFLLGIVACNDQGKLGCAAAVGQGLALPETCDGVDSDCNGLVDDVLGVGEACDNGKLGSCIEPGVLACSGGQLVCDAGPGEPPQDEVCDGLDNDCDGLVDDVPGVGGACDNGALGVCLTSGVVACKGGALVCSAGSGQGPSSESCDGLDNDCDGEVDNLAGVGTPCHNGQPGVCFAQGSVQCIGGGLKCTAPYGPEAAFTELCDGLDSDCDGVVDNVDGAGAACDNGGLGACLATGVIECGEGGLVCTAGLGLAPAGELCNGQDDDCNGVVDDVAGLGGPCTNGLLGACLTVGELACDGLTHTVVCMQSQSQPAGPGPVPADEQCDGLDNNCNGLVDDVVGIGGPCTQGQGSCEASGQWACDLQTGLLTCNAEPLEGSAELCDGLDNDCDGQVDNKPACAVPSSWVWDFSPGDGVNGYVLGDPARATFSNGEVTLAAPSGDVVELASGRPTAASFGAAALALDGLPASAWLVQGAAWWEVDLQHVAALNKLTLTFDPAPGAVTVEWGSVATSSNWAAGAGALASTDAAAAGSSVDGDPDTGWQASGPGHWLELDLQEPRPLGALRVFGAQAEPKFFVSGEGTSPDIAHAKATWVSGGSDTASLAVDGDPSSAWSPVFGAQWATPSIEVDLGANGPVRLVEVVLAAGAADQDLLVEVASSGSVVDFALGATVTPSGPAFGAYPAEHAVDGLAETSWRPLGSGTHRLELDLGMERSIGAVDLLFEPPQAGVFGWELEGSPNPTSADLAAGKAVSDSGAQPGFPSELAVDGNAATSWVSVEPDLFGDQFLRVDLGQNEVVRGVGVEITAGANFEVRTSLTADADNAVAVVLGEADGTTIGLAPVTARYVWLVLIAGDLPIGVSTFSVYSSVFGQGATHLANGEQAGGTSQSVPSASWRYLRLTAMGQPRLHQLRVRESAFLPELAVEATTADGAVKVALVGAVGRYVRVSALGTSDEFGVATLRALSSAFELGGMSYLGTPSEGAALVLPEPSLAQYVRLVWESSVGSASEIWLSETAFEQGKQGDLAFSGDLPDEVVGFFDPGSQARVLRVSTAAGAGALGLAELSVTGAELGLEPQTVTTQLQPLVAAGADFELLSAQAVWNGQGSLTLGLRSEPGQPFLPLGPPDADGIWDLTAVEAPSGAVQLELTLQRDGPLTPAVDLVEIQFNVYE